MDHQRVKGADGSLAWLDTLLPEPHGPALEAVASEVGGDLKVGESLLATAWVALASARAEAVDIHLRSGAMVTNAIAVRINGAIGEASTRRGHWTHAFAIADVVMVRQIPRGGRRMSSPAPIAPVPV